MLIDTHVSAWNRVEALRQFERCRAILIDELGLLPGEELAAAAARAHGPAAVTQASRQILSSVATDSAHAN